MRWTTRLMAWVRATKQYFRNALRQQLRVCRYLLAAQDSVFNIQGAKRIL